MHHLCHGWEPPLTTKTASFAGCLDYIWLSRGGDDRPHFKVLQTLDLPYEIPTGSDSGATTAAAGSSSGATAHAAGGVSGSGAAIAGPAWEDPLLDIDFPPIPNEAIPSDHLAMGWVRQAVGACGTQ